MHKVYFLINPNTGKVFYIGVTKFSLAHRKRAHISDSKDGFSDNKRKSNTIRRLNYNFFIVLVESFVTRKEALNRERELITLFHDKGLNICNIVYIKRRTQSLK